MMANTNALSMKLKKKLMEWKIKLVYQFNLELEMMQNKQEKIELYLKHSINLKKQMIIMVKELATC